ncbi:MAG: hypothetical protein Q8O59_04360 [bacterium]|nr:hypothetical protein [bacterium]
MYSEESELMALIQNGIAQNLAQAMQILNELKAKKRRADMLIFYLDVNKVRPHFGKQLVDERLYNYSEVRVARISSGLMSKQKNGSFSNGSVVFGKLTEFVSRPKGKKGKQDARLVAYVREFPYQGKGGIFLSPYSAKTVHARGNTTIDERENLFRIEIKRIGGDFILGMFKAWKKQPISETTALALYLPKASALFL